jgi:hypothetical protein
VSSDGTDSPAGGSAFEMGRLVQGFASMQSAVVRIEGKLDNVATKADIAEVRALAQAALDRANAANTRLDSMGPWRQIAVALVTALILSGIGAVAVNSLH